MDLDPNHFDEVYEQNQREALERGLKSCPIYPAPRGMLDVPQLGFHGSYQELLQRLNGYREGDVSGWLWIGVQNCPGLRGDWR